MFKKLHKWKKVGGQNKNAKKKICATYEQARFIYLKIHIQKYSKQRKEIISNCATTQIMQHFTSQRISKCFTEPPISLRDCLINSSTYIHRNNLSTFEISLLQGSSQQQELIFKSCIVPGRGHMELAFRSQGVRQEIMPGGGSISRKDTQVPRTGSAAPPLAPLPAGFRHQLLREAAHPSPGLNHLSYQSSLLSPCFKSDSSSFTVLPFLLKMSFDFSDQLYISFQT